MTKQPKAVRAWAVYVDGAIVLCSSTPATPKRRSKR